MRQMYIETGISIVAVLVVAALLHQVDGTIRLLLTMLVVFIGVFRLSDVVRQE